MTEKSWVDEWKDDHPIRWRWCRFQDWLDYMWWKLRGCPEDPDAPY